MYHIQYTTQIWEQIAFKIPSETSVTTDCFCLPGLPFGFGDEDGAVVLANINQSHSKVFNRVLNGISSRSANNITRAHTHTHAHTHQVYHRPQQQKKRRRALIQQGGEVSQPPWKPERRSGGVRL